MKRFFTIAAMICAVAMTACTDPNENPYDGAPEPVFTLSTTSVELPQAGGNFEVPFTIENPGEWAQVRATTATKWIKDLAWDAEAKKITFTAAANNSDDPLTGGVITVAYNFKEYNISVTQLGIAYDYRWTVEAENTVAVYYGADYESVANATLSLAAFDGENMIGIADLDLFVPYVNDFCFDVPVGVYEFDAEDSMEPGTIGNEYSYVSTDVENDFVDEAMFASGALEVTKDGWVARMFDENGKSYRIECEGTIHVDGEGSDYEYIMGITEDLEITGLDGGMMGYYYWGNEYGEGTHAYQFQIMDMMGAVGQLVLWVISEDEELDKDTMPTGTFKVAEVFEDMSGCGNVVGASVLSGSSIYNSYGMYVPTMNYLWIKGGDLTITEDEEPNEYDATTYTFKLNFTDASHAAHKITGEFSVECMFATDKSSVAPQAQAVNFEVPAYPAKARR